MNSKLMLPVLYWQTSLLVSKEASTGMDHRAMCEISEILKGKSLEEVHEQAARDFPYIEQLVEGASLFLKRNGSLMHGTGIDLGSGTGVGACILSKTEKITKIFALEISEQFVIQIMPKVFEDFNADTKKIQRVVGDFNKLELPDNSLDFIFDLDSLHHSEDLNVTLQECYRVLKPDRAIIMIERGWDDKITREELEEKLDQELSQKLKEKYGISSKMKFTRRDWGEHEYRLKDWEGYFSANGFSLNIFSQKHPPFLNSIFLKYSTFHWSIENAVKRYQRGLTRHTIYGFNKNRRLMIAQKQPNIIQK